MDSEQTDQQFLEFIAKALVDNPNDVHIDRAVDEMGVRLSLKVNPQDMGMIIGREGKTVTAIRSLLKIIGRKNHARVSLVVEEPEGGRQPRIESHESVGGVQEVIDDLREEL